MSEHDAAPKPNKIERMGKKRRTGGRRPGSPNKITTDVKTMILGALTDLGGREWLVAQGKKHPQSFMALCARLVPRDIKLDLPDVAKLADQLRLARERAEQLRMGAVVDVTPAPKELARLDS